MRVGDVVAERFEIEGLAGTGGMGSVFRSRDRHAGGLVALKVLNDDDPYQTERFAREARALAELGHPAVVGYVAHGITPEGRRWLAMEWLEGEGLAQRLERAPLPVSDTVALGARIGEALAVAHARGIVHRDIKPSNLFLVEGRPDRVKVLDFGIVRLSFATHAHTRPGTRVGTPGYMSPEQARGDDVIDARADVFSLGCVLFRCLAGRSPFRGGDPMAVMAKILLEEPPKLRDLAKHVPPALEALIARMMAKDAAARPADGGAVAAELEALTIHDTVASPPSIPAPASMTVWEQSVLSVVLLGARPADPDARRELGEIAQRHGGRLDRLVGSGMIATLAGTGIATDQAARAARCALALRAALPDADLALATGRGVVSTRRRGSDVPVGDALDRGVALLRAVAADPSPRDRRAVAIDPVTAGLLDGRFEVESEARGGRSLLRLVRERESPDAPRTLLGRPSPFVGRARELDLLLASWDECAGERVARAVLVTAPAGVGKSRLRQELVAALKRRGEALEIWIGHGDAMRAGSPFALLAPAIRRTAGIRAGEPPAVAREKLRARVSRSVAAADVDRVAEFLGELLGAGAADAASVQLRAARADARLMADQMRRAWEDFLAAECRSRPVLLVLEDLHWGDLPTVQFVDHALRALHDRPFMALAVARPDVHELFPRLWSGRGLTEVQLPELTRRAAETLVRGMLPEAVPAGAVGRLVARAAGNAFFLEELIRAWADGAKEELPDTVLAMVQGRLEALPADARLALRAASVFGDVFWVDGVAALLGGAERAEDLPAWLAELAQRELVLRRGEAKFPGQVEYVFRHALVREAAYALLTDRDRVTGHQLAADWLVRAGEPDAAVVAEHLQRGGEPERAAAQYCRAAAQALEGNDVAATLVRAERAAACGAAGELLGEVERLRAEAHAWRGDNAEAQARGTLALRWLAPGGPSWFAAGGALASAVSRLADYDRLEALGAELAEVAPAAPAVAGPQVVALATTVCGLLLGGRAAAAAPLAARVEAAAGATVDEPAVAGWVQRMRSIRLALDGDAARSQALSEHAADEFGIAGDLRNACVARVNVGQMAVELGELERAETVLRDALATAERLGLGHVAAVARQVLGLGAAFAGRTAEALALEAEALGAFLARADHRREASARIYLARILAACGELADAEREARQAVELSRPVWPAHSYARAVLAYALRRQGRAAEALTEAWAGRELLERLGGILDGEAFVRLEHAESLRAAGEPGAQGAAAAARNRLLARAALIDDPARRERFLRGVPDNARTLALAESF